MSTKALTQQSDGVSLIDFGRMLAALREKRQLSQLTLAQRLGRSTSLISLLESGKRSPTRELVSDLVRALDLPHEETLQLLGAAGFSEDELTNALQQVVEIICKQTTVDVVGKSLLKDDLASVAEAWKQLFEGTKELRTGNLPAAEAIFLMMEARPQYSPTLVVYLKLSQADRLMQAGRLSAARNLIHEALRLMEQWPEDWASTLRAEVIAIRGMLALRTGRYETAKEFITESMSLYIKLLYRGTRYESIAALGLAKSYKRLAQLALLEGDPDQALAYCAAAESHLQQAKKESTTAPQWLRRTRELKAWAYSKLNNPQEAIRLHTQALEDCRRAGDEYGVIKNTLYLGDDYRRLLDVLIGKAGGYDVLTPEERRRIVKESLVGEAATWLEKAEAYYREAREGCIRVHDDLLRGRCMSGLGGILRLKGTRDQNEADHTEAFRSLQEALLLEREIGLERRLPGIYEALAKLCWDQGRFVTARRYYQMALDALDSPLVSSADPASKRQRQRIRRLLQVLAVDALPQEAEEDNHMLLGTAPAWQNTCQNLIQVVRRAISECKPGFIGHDQEIDWLNQMLWLEQEQSPADQLQGPRLLAQNQLSASLTLSLPAGFPTNGATAHEQRNKAFLQQVQLASNPASQGPYEDLCCRDTIERGLQNRDTRTLYHKQVKEAHALLDRYQGYRLHSGLYELPLAFAVRGNRTLVEIPEALIAGFRAAQISTISDPTRYACYRFDDAALAQRLSSIFHDLVKVAEESVRLRGSTKEWLRHLISEEPPLTRVL